jgi:hypothetical protein
VTVILAVWLAWRLLRRLLPLLVLVSLLLLVLAHAGRIAQRVTSELSRVGPGLGRLEHHIQHGLERSSGR